MALRLPPLSGLRLFEAAARCGSFKRAAQELNLTPGALSHGIDSLEQWLNVELFERKARGVILTPAGRQFLPYVSEALSLISTGTLRLPSKRFEDRLSISATGLFAYKLLLPRLHKFREADLWIGRSPRKFKHRDSPMQSFIAARPKSTYPPLENWCWELRDWHWKPRPKDLELQWAVCR